MQSDEFFSNRVLALFDIINANGLGLWEIADNWVTLDPKTSEIIGMSGDVQIELDAVFERIHKDDLRAVQHAIDSIESAPDKNGLIECRIFSETTSSYSWVRIMAKSYLNQGKMVVVGTTQRIDGRALGIVNSMLADITKELTRKDELNKCIFDITEILLNADDLVFEETFQNCLEIIARTVGLSRIYVYKNHISDGTLCCTEIYEWSDESMEKTLGEEYAKDIPIHSWPGLEETFSTGKVYSRLIKDTPEEIQRITPEGIAAILLSPIFLKELLWGFVGYEWKTEQFVDADAETILCSAGLLLANSLIRNDLNKNLYLAVDKINTTAIKAEVLEKFAYTDTLTGLYNRRYFMGLAQGPLDKAKRFNNHCYAMMMDIDFFKKVNDSYGHLAGDEVLKSAANVMKNTLRSYDLLCRYGGEEFVVLVTDTTKEAVLHLAERIREAVASTPILYNGISIFVTISIGIAANCSECTIESIIGRADKALYRAKETGRNRVVFYDETIAALTVNPHNV